MLETALQVEMGEHLGYERGDRAGHGSGNSRTGSTGKTVRTDVGDFRIEVRRDRAGTFAPAVIPKHSRRLAGFDAAGAVAVRQGWMNMLSDLRNRGVADVCIACCDCEDDPAPLRVAA